MFLYALQFYDSRIKATYKFDVFYKNRAWQVQVQNKLPIIE